MSFGSANKYFSEFLQPRKCSSLDDFMEFGLVPDLKGVYRSDFIRHMGRPKEALYYFWNDKLEEIHDFEKHR